MDPNGNLYYRSTVTGQSSRQHPLDEYYQNLYLKLKMQRMMEVAGMGVPDDLQGKDLSALTSEDLRRMRSHLAAKMEGEASVQRQSAPREVSAATTSSFSDASSPLHCTTVGALPCGVCPTASFVMRCLRSLSTSSGGTGIGIPCLSWCRPMITDGTQPGAT